MDGKNSGMRYGQKRAGKEKGRGKKGQARLSRDPKWSSERSTHLQAKVEFGALDALDAQARDVFLAIGAVVLRVQI